MNEVARKPSPFAAETSELTFNTPWEAHAFAIVVKLHEQGVFSWSEWNLHFAEAIRVSENNAVNSYYQDWLIALEKILLEKGVIELAEYRQEIDSVLTTNSDHAHQEHD